MRALLSFLLLLSLQRTAYTQTIPYSNYPDWESNPLGHVATGLGLADINGDGWKDIIVANGNDILRQRLVVYYNQGDGTFPPYPDWQSSDIDYHGHLSAGDINKDGWPDVAVSVYLGPNGFGDPGEVKIYYNLGGELEVFPSFESEPFYTFSCVLGDADGDGDLDLATTGGEPYSSQFDEGKVFINRNGTFSAAPGWESAFPFGSLDVEFGDADRNGFLDLIFTSEATPNYLFLADANGAISAQPSWQSAEPANYINSVDFGLTGPGQAPGIVMTGNNQLGGDGKVRLYEFDGGVPGSSNASWLSATFGYGSGILLASIDGDEQLDLVYGGWWLPVKIALGTPDGFEASPGYTSMTNSVVEAIQMADLDRDGIATAVETFVISQEGTAVLSLSRQLVEKILTVHLNGIPVSLAFYCRVENRNWISFSDRLKTGDTVIIEYEYSTRPDIVVTNWDGEKGNYIFYNTTTTGSGSLNAENITPGKVTLSPNPASGQVVAEVYLDGAMDFHLTIIDLTGKTVFHRSAWEGIPGKNRVVLDVTDLAPGVYHLRVISECMNETRKLVVTR